MEMIVRRTTSTVLSSPQKCIGTGSTEYGVSAVTEVEHHVLSDSIPFFIRFVRMSSVPLLFLSTPKKRPVSVRESFRIFCDNLGIRNTQFFVSFFLPFYVVVH